MLVELYAEYAPAKLIDFLRASSYYNLEAVSLKSSLLLSTQIHLPVGV